MTNAQWSSAAFQDPVRSHGCVLPISLTGPFYPVQSYDRTATSSPQCMADKFHVPQASYQPHRVVRQMPNRSAQERGSSRRIGAVAYEICPMKNPGIGQPLEVPVAQPWSAGGSSTRSFRRGAGLSRRPPHYEMSFPAANAPAIASKSL